MITIMLDSEDDFLQPALAIEDNADDFDLDIPPVSGHQYLRMVQQEARQCPSVVVARLDRSSFHKKQSAHICPPSSLHKAPPGFSPSISWQTEQIADFSEVRQAFTRQKIRTKRQRRSAPYPLPKVDDFQGWCRLCFGKLQVKTINEEGVPEQCDQTATENVGKNENLNKEDSNLHESGSPPLISIVAYMDQPTVIKVLEYHLNWFEATGFTVEQGRWFYALLVCLEKPLDPEACSLLRDLARSCASHRATLDSPLELRCQPLNLLICLVARYFDQMDLADTG